MNTFLKLKYLLYILYGKIMRWFLAHKLFLGFIADLD